VTWAVAWLAALSAVSTTLRFSPFSVPSCAARGGRDDPRALAAIRRRSRLLRQQTTLKKLVCSSHSCDWRFCQRRLTATPNDALAAPPVV
jgi:hypothetical protein